MRARHRPMHGAPTHPEAPLANDSAVPTPASLFRPSTMAMLSSQKSTCDRRGGDELHPAPLWPAAA